MRKTGLERAIDAAIEEFTTFIIDAVRSMPLDELSKLRGEDLIEKPEPVEADLIESAPVLAPQSEPQPEPKPDPSPKIEPEVKKKDHPKCAYPGCTRNRFVRGHGYCSKHWRWWKKGKIGLPGDSVETPTDLLSVKEVVSLLDLPEHTIRRLYALGQLPGGHQLGPRRLRFERGSIEEWSRSPDCEKIKHRRARRVWRAKGSEDSFP